MKNDINIWYMALEEINKKIIHKKYTFISVPNYIESYFLKDSKKAMQIYWKELLQRLHLASVTSLMRNFKWIEGIKFGIDSNNYIIFASSLRGYIEAFVDSYYSTNFKSIDISENFSNISNALKGKLEGTLMSKEFEESLIHFYWASKNQNTETHKVVYLDPLTTKKYLEKFDLPGSEQKFELYSELCEIVHPASPSVRCFTKEECEVNSNTIQTVDGKDRQLIEGMLKQYSDLLNLIFRISNTVPIVNLRTLNYFNDPCIDAHYIKDSLINKLAVRQEGWKIIEQKLRLD